jgi:hypothetical protein
LSGAEAGPSESPSAETRSQFVIAVGARCVNLCHVGLDRTAQFAQKLEIAGDRGWARTVLQAPPMSRLPLLVFILTVLAGGALSSAAFAQSINASDQPYPDRILPDGTNLGPSTRPQNLNPQGISYQDCIDDQTLQFTLVLTGFTGADEVEVWASLSSDCTEPTDRGIGATAAVCWGLPGPGGRNDIPGLQSNGNRTYTFSVRVQDLLAWQVTPPIPSAALSPPAQGVSACHVQPTFAAVSMKINFLAINGDGQSDGTPYPYTLSTDTVGPPAPSGVGESAGDTLLDVTWTQNTDSDTAGYDVYIDPVPGSMNDEASIGDASAGRTLVCPEAGSTAVEASVVDGSGDATSSCYYVNTGSSTQGSAGAHCNDSVLEGAITQDAGPDGSIIVTEPVYDEAGDLLSEGGVEEGSGGISTISPAYLIGVSSGTGMTLSDKSVGQYQITGLTDGNWYNVVVAAVDGTGNIGPASPQVCDYPAPVSDFWQTYRQDGGQAGAFCALGTVGAGGTSLAGVGAVVLGAALARRRRRGERRSKRS